MHNSSATKLQRLLVVLAAVLVLKVTLSVMLGYRDYFPPNFGSDFLRGRQVHFFGLYQWAFYAHILSGPLSIVLGLVLLSDGFRLRFPQSHRAIGKMQVANVLLLLTPSGLWMARYAQTGSVAATGFALLALVTAACVLMGWRSAVKRQFVVHRRWMWRAYILLCSAVVLRLIGGLATVSNISGMWPYPLAAWVSWLAPLAAYEIGRITSSRFRRSHIKPHNSQFSPPSTTTSFPAAEIIARRAPASTS
jgi:hypothetical protein